jgi:hypothetical protein
MHGDWLVFKRSFENRPLDQKRGGGIRVAERLDFGEELGAKRGTPSQTVTSLVELAGLGRLAALGNADSAAPLAGYHNPRKHSEPG